MSADVRMRFSAQDDASGTIKKIQREMYGLKSGMDNNQPVNPRLCLGTPKV